MENNNIEKFLNSCDELIGCKFLVAEYKLQKMLQELANAQEICSLIGECLESFNRDREFSKSFVQDGNGEFMFILPDEEFKILALVFCTLVDIDAKKIDFTDFVKRFFGTYQEFVNTMIIPFRDLIKEAFGFSQEKQLTQNDNAEENETEENENYDEEYEDNNEDFDKFDRAQKIAVQILGQLEYARDDYANSMAKQICRAIVKCANQNDEEVMSSLAFALKSAKAKQVKFLVKELCELF